MEIVITIIIVAYLIRLAMKVWNREREFREASLSKAWHVVLSDPNYKKRRSLQERNLQKQ